MLLGTPETNSVFGSLKETSSVTIAEAGITIGSKTWKGGNISFQAVLAPKTALDRKIIIIGSNGVAPPVYPTMNLSVHGWHDYALWRQDSDGGRLIEAGVWK